MLKQSIIYFLVGGGITAAIVLLENAGLRLWSGLAALVPVFTLISYLFIGETRGGAAVGQHAWLVLIGTLVSWVPYMIFVAVFAPKIGPHKAVPAGFLVFFVLAAAYLAIVERYRLFR